MKNFQESNILLLEPDISQIFIASTIRIRKKFWFDNLWMGALMNVWKYVAMLIFVKCRSIAKFETIVQKKVWVVLNVISTHSETQSNYIMFIHFIELLNNFKYLEILVISNSFFKLYSKISNEINNIKPNGIFSRYIKRICMVNENSIEFPPHLISIFQTISFSLPLFPNIPFIHIWLDTRMWF